MTLKNAATTLGWSVACGADRLDQEITGGYAGDLLSDVMANAKAGSVWITMQVHLNIVAVAVLKDLAGILLVQGRRPAEDTLKKAREEHMPIILSDAPAFETAGKLFGLLKNGR